MFTPIGLVGATQHGEILLVQLAHWFQGDCTDEMLLHFAVVAPAAAPAATPIVVPVVAVAAAAVAHPAAASGPCVGCFGWVCLSTHIAAVFPSVPAIHLHRKRVFLSLPGTPSTSVPCLCPRIHHGSPVPPKGMQRAHSGTN